MTLSEKKSPISPFLAAKRAQQPVILGYRKEGRKEERERDLLLFGILRLNISAEWSQIFMKFSG